MAQSKTALTSFEKSAEAQQTASRLPELELEARKLASLIQGLRSRNVVGRGSQFHSFEQFRNGYDEPRNIDYRSSAKRVDRQGKEMLMIRQRELEVTQMVYLFRDGSKSMDLKAPKSLFPTQPPFTKKETAEILMLAVAYLAASAGERFSMLGSNLKMSGNKQGVDRIALELSLENASGEDLPKLPTHRGRPLGKNSQVFIFSDFLMPTEEIRAMVETLHTVGAKVHLVQVLDPSEVQFRYKKHVKFKDLESTFSHTLKKAESAKAEIEELVQNHIREVTEMIARVPGWSFSTFVTDQPLHEALLPLYGIPVKPSAPGANR